MSRKNGDKARFGRQRNRKALLRKKTRELRKVLMGQNAGVRSRRGGLKRYREGRAVAEYRKQRNGRADSVVRFCS